MSQKYLGSLRNSQQRLKNIVVTETRMTMHDKSPCFPLRGREINSEV